MIVDRVDLSGGPCGHMIVDLGVLRMWSLWSLWTSWTYACDTCRPVDIVDI